MKVTIDGPAGVGKTSVGRELARRFSLLFVQSGKLYRALAYGKINDLAIGTLSLTIGTGGGLEITMEEKPISDELDTEEIAEEASKLAKKKEMREIVNSGIIELARDRDVLVEGRDIGTEVLPEAELKIYLTAEARERAKRRKKQLDTNRSLAEIEAGIIRRDERDLGRKVAPLKPAEDAVIIDTTNLSKVEVVDRVASLIQERIRK